MSRGLWLSVAATAALVGYLFSDTLPCVDRCVVDPIAVRGPGLGHIELPDVHLNSWILAWVQHALTSDPSGLFDANIFHPTRATLTQSEHMLAVSLWTLPLRIFSDSAVWLHQSALIGSSLLLALFTGALVRWLTGSGLAGFAAGAMALWMPWRFTELSHVQLMNAQWFPLVWWQIGRVVEEPERRGPAVGLAVALTLQLLSSFYLAYFLLLSCAGLLAGLWCSARPSAAAWKRLALAAAPAFAALFAMALPYLRWGREQGFQAIDVLFDSVPPADVLSLTLPDLSIALRGLPVETSYAVPLVVALLCLVALAALRRAGGPEERRRRGFAIGLLLASAFAFVLAHGRQLTLGGWEIPLPGALAAAVVPGFENLRNPLRFAIVIGIAAPVLAGVGFARLQAWVPSGPARLALELTLLALLALNLITPPLPARDAWEGSAQQAYRALADLPRGALIEMPWPLQPEHDVILASRYMLGSTLHWQPLVNGNSGYIPRSYPLLRQVAQALPSEEGLRRVQELVDVRWILVHDALQAPAERGAWIAAAQAGRLRAVFTAGDTHLYEVVDWRSGGRYRDALADPASRSVTLAGLARLPLTPEHAGGSLRLEIDGVFHFAGRRRIPKPVSLFVENPGPGIWPGLDPDPEGLVRLRYAFIDADGREALRESSALATDVTPGVHALSVPISPPARAGRYRLRVDLVQRLRGEDRALAAPPSEIDVRVEDIL